MGYRVFDRRRLKLKPLEERVHDFNVSQVLSLSDETPPFEDRRIAEIARRIVDARSRGSQVIFMMGAHVIKVGLSRFVIELMKKGMVTHVAGNGAVAIHDFELSLIGATTESVAKYIRTGEFGLWKETGMINDIAREAAEEGIGFGEAIGRAIEEGDFPYKDISILATGYRLGIPVTIHVGIGYDIIHEHPNCDGAALGAASYMDFLIFAASIEGLEGGVFLNYGSAVMGFISKLCPWRGTWRDRRGGR
jgi:deoxyhypusine synthase